MKYSQAFSLSLVLLLFFLQPSCRKKEPAALIFHMGSTKGPLAEWDYTHVAVFVFDAETRQLENSGIYAQGETPRLNVSFGRPYRWWVIGNPPEGLGAASWTGHEETFKRTLSLLTDNGGERLVMFDNGALENPVQEQTQVSVSLRRYACKVSVKTIRIAFKDIYLSPEQAYLSRIILVNANGSVPYSGHPADNGIWYNLGEATVDPESIEGHMTLAEYPLAPFRVEGNEEMTLEPNCTLYAMPNPATDGKPTRVSLEVVIDGQRWWYPATLPAMACNKHYALEELTILGPGSSDPDSPVSKDPVCFSLSIKAWDDRTTPVVFPTD